MKRLLYLSVKDCKNTMKGITTKDAMTLLLLGNPRLKKSDKSGNTWRTYRKRFFDGKLPTDKVEKILEEAGFKVVQEKLWEAPPARE